MVLIRVDWWWNTCTATCTMYVPQYYFHYNNSVDHDQGLHRNLHVLPSNCTPTGKAYYNYITQ